MGHDAFGGAAMDPMPGLKAIAPISASVTTPSTWRRRPPAASASPTPRGPERRRGLAVAMWFAQARDFETAIQNARSGDWGAGEGCRWRKASGRQVGVLGMGRIGREIADRLAAFRRKSITSRAAGTRLRAGPITPIGRFGARRRRSIIAIGGPATEGSFPPRSSRRWGRIGVIVNIARGSVIDEEGADRRAAIGRDRRRAGRLSRRAADRSAC